MDTFEELIDECTDDKYPAMMDDFVNEEHDDMIFFPLNDENKIGLDKE